MIKTLTKNNRGGKGFIWLASHSLSSREAKAGIQAATWRQELTVEDAAYWLTSHGLLSLFPYIFQAHQPRTGIVDSELGSPLSGSNKQMLHRNAHRPI